MKEFVLAVIVALVLIGAGVQLFVRQQKPVNPPATTTVSVLGNRPWTPSGIRVQQGDPITISASGAVYMGSGWPPMPPSGRRQGCSAAFVAPNLPCWSLLGKIGPEGNIFEVGSGVQLRSPASGELYLGVNDDNHADNSGIWIAEVILRPSAQLPNAPVPERTARPTMVRAAIRVRPNLDAAGASEASVAFDLPTDSLVVIIGLASSQQEVILDGVPQLEVDASSSDPSATEGLVIAHAYLKPGTCHLVEHSAALAAGQDSQHMADLLGVFVFGQRT